ncbi:MFS transporter [Bifidobacterium pullorum subsp. gallinarum]|uniref:MFS transporter n=1 Tax=Bifidobacterium pullorum subsp. gallinarum TaxID=78344 RepID=A0A4V0YAX0_9BIFI|nr:MFS transporter [Bifidobacterium pullorum subsp. gallinarum]
MHRHSTNPRPAPNNGHLPRRPANPLLGRDYILLVMGQGLSLFGSMMLRFAMSMWVLDETGSATVFASVLAAAIVPTILLSPFGGVLADRVNRRTIMVALDAGSGLLVLAAASWFAVQDGGFSIIAVGALMVSLSVLSAFETPTVQAALPQLLRGSGEAVIRRGMAVINQVQQLSSLLPSFIGGALYGLIGIGPLLGVTIACFFCTAALECFIRLEPPQKNKPREPIPPAMDHARSDHSTPHPDGTETTPSGTARGWISDIAAALQFLTHERPNILRLMLLASVINLFAVGYSAVGFPFMIRTVLGFDAAVYGICDGIIGIAAVIGAILAGLFATALTIDRMPTAMAALGAVILPAGVGFLLPLGNMAELIALVSSCCLVSLACSFTNIIAIPAIQIRTPETMTGKVMSLLASFATCAQPLGQMLYGWLYDTVAPEWILVGTAAAILMLSAVSAPLFAHFDGPSHG